MSSTSNMNIILGQGNAVKEVHNPKKQNLEVSQQFVAQDTEEEKQADKSRVLDTKADNRIEDRHDETKKRKRKRKAKGPKKRRKRNGRREDEDSPEGKLIDITV